MTPEYFSGFFYLVLLWMLERQEIISRLCRIIRETSHTTHFQQYRYCPQLGNYHLHNLSSMGFYHKRSTYRQPRGAKGTHPTRGAKGPTIIVPGQRDPPITWQYNTDPLLGPDTM
ncbi:hypothetical protein DVH24_031586 [Malus domestica]|uniref:Uncharacterized protein n=1 Tax=Malus domestica TaxID=3750 RepID=A0A498J0J2_MALDO|nr:hypothetical protein DVH24_031586 [Malus domestica]